MEGGFVAAAEELEVTQLVETLFPIRCEACGKVLGNKQIPFERLIQRERERVLRGEIPKIDLGMIMTELGITNYCCRDATLNPPLIPAVALQRQAAEAGPRIIHLTPVRSMRRWEPREDLRIRPRAMEEEEAEGELEPGDFFDEESENYELEAPEVPMVGALQAMQNLSLQSQPLGQGFIPPPAYVHPLPMETFAFGLGTVDLPDL